MRHVRRMECLPGSPQPDARAKLGYRLKPDDPTEGQRILHSAIPEQMVAGPSGELVPLSPGSTKPVALTLSHAGIVTVSRWWFKLP